MNLRITWLGHATVVMDIGPVRLITDPLLGRHAGLLRRRGPTPERSTWERADAVLVSHLHYYHAELRSLRLLPDVPVLAAPANAAWLRKHGVPRAVGLAEDDWYPVGDGDGDGAVRIRIAPAVHAGRPMPHCPNAANGHLVRHPGGVVWAVGDTEEFPDLSRLTELAGGGIDVALVPVGGWAPRLSRVISILRARPGCARWWEPGSRSRCTGGASRRLGSAACRAAGWTGPVPIFPLSSAGMRHSASPWCSLPASRGSHRHRGTPVRRCRGDDRLANATRGGNRPLNRLLHLTPTFTGSVPRHATCLVPHFAWQARLENIVRIARMGSVTIEDAPSPSADVSPPRGSASLTRTHIQIDDRVTGPRNAAPLLSLFLAPKGFRMPASFSRPS